MEAYRAGCFQTEHKSDRVRPVFSRTQEPARFWVRLSFCTHETKKAFEAANFKGL